MSNFFKRVSSFLESIFGKSDEPIHPKNNDSQSDLTFEKDNEHEAEEERLRLEEEAKERAAEEERVRLEEEAKEQEKSQEKSELNIDDFQDVIVDDEKLAETVEPELIEGISERRKSVEKEAKLRLEDIEDE